MGFAHARDKVGIQMQCTNLFYIAIIMPCEHLQQSDPNFTTICCRLLNNK